MSLVDWADKLKKKSDEEMDRLLDWEPGPSIASDTFYIVMIIVFAMVIGGMIVYMVK